MQHLFTGHALAKSPVTFREMRTLRDEGVRERHGEAERMAA